MAKTNKRKLGDVLEDFVALLHDLPGVSVKTRVKIEVPNEDRKREVDVLVAPQLVGDPVPIVIECKNHKGAVGVGLIDEFIGKLRDIAVPPERGIFVSSMGFSSGAVKRAAKEGIQLLRKRITSDGSMQVCLMKTAFAKSTNRVKCKLRPWRARCCRSNECQG